MIHKTYTLTMKVPVPFSSPLGAEETEDDLCCQDCEYYEILETSGCGYNYPTKMKCRILNVKFNGHMSANAGYSVETEDGECVLEDERLKGCPFVFKPLTLQEMMNYLSGWLEVYKGDEHFKDEWDKVATLFDDSMCLIEYCSDIKFDREETDTVQDNIRNERRQQNESILEEE